MEELDANESDDAYQPLSKYEREKVREHWRSKYTYLPPPWKTTSLWVGPMQLSNGYSRLVVGDHGAYLEIPREKMLLENLVIHDIDYITFKCKDRAFLLKDEANLVLQDDKWLKEHTYHRKYVLLEPKGRQERIYLQAATVKYADYKVGMFYIHPLLVDFKTTND